jgi:hypothetical protein
VTNPTRIYGSTLDLVFTGGHLPSIIYNGCYYSDHMTLLIQKNNTKNEVNISKHGEIKW